MIHPDLLKITSFSQKHTCPFCKAKMFDPTIDHPILARHYQAICWFQCNCPYQPKLHQFNDDSSDFTFTWPDEKKAFFWTLKVVPEKHLYLEFWIDGGNVGTETEAEWFLPYVELDYSDPIAIINKMKLYRTLS